MNIDQFKNRTAPGGSFSGAPGQGAAKGGIMRRLKGTRGFSLAEMLLAVLILLLVSTIVATGTPVAADAYNKVILGANAKVMLSTAITALHDELGTAWQVEPKNDTTLAYFKAGTGAKTQLTIGSDSRIKVLNYRSLSADNIHDTNEAPEGYTLVPDRGEKYGDMFATYTKISYDKNTHIVTIKGLKVCKAKDKDTVLAEFKKPDGSDEFTIRVISADSIEAETGDGT